MTAGDLVRTLWQRMETGDWDGARATLADDFTCNSPADGRRYGSPDAFIAMNQGYPQGWTLTIDEIVVADERVVARMRVHLAGTLLHCLSFADVADGRISRSIDFWVKGVAVPDPTPPKITEEQL